MQLKKIEVFGFKSFAQKTVLEFPGGITCLIGPNGSGKSNLIEAIRWATGEQNLKILRGKKGEDVIFSGSHQRTRLNLAEVSLYLNDDKNLFGFSELKITRRIFRHGEGEYLLNDKKVKCQDILLLLAKANFGQKSYSIIGQGMVDVVLNSVGEERREFFYEATGVKQYQIKRHQSFLKIKKSLENLRQAESVFQEIEPRMKFLTRQINRFNKRQVIEEKLRELQKEYYGYHWFRLGKTEQELRKKIETIRQKKKIVSEELKEKQKIFRRFDEKENNQLIALQQIYHRQMEERKRVVEKFAFLKAEALLKPGIKRDWQEIQENLREIQLSLEKLLYELKNVQNLAELKKTENFVLSVIEKIKNLLGDFPLKKEIIISQKFKEVENDLKLMEQEINETEQKIQTLIKEESQKREKILEDQKKIQNKQEELNLLNNQLQEWEIELAKIETRKDDLIEEIKRETNNQLQVNQLMFISNLQDENELLHKIQHDQRQLELIGGIDPHLTQEYEECRLRYDFLSSQIIDLKKAINSLQKIIVQLDEKIKNEFVANLNKINQGFERYFKNLFNGGKAKIVVLKNGKREENIEKNIQKDTEEKEIIQKENNSIFANELSEEKEEKFDLEIYAQPPGKKIKNIEILSGGEKALTSLALICAILATNRPPFVVLDEVDATLDQVNSLRFVEILRELTEKTQFIIVTHNTITMETTDIFYGITMGTEGVSKITSLKLEKV